MRYLRLWWQFVAMGVARQTEFRLSFWLDVLGGWAGLGLSVMLFAVVYRFTGEVAGWRQAEVLVVVGLYQLANGLWDALVWRGMRQLSELIERGEMDYLLLRPVDTQFLVSLRRVDLPAAVPALTGLALVVHAGRAAGIAWTACGVLAGLVLLASGLMWFYALRFMTVTLAFWLVNVDNLDVLLHSAWEAARYPVTFFRGGVRAFLTVAVPVAFITTFPAQALLGTVSPWLLAGGVLGALAALWLSHTFFTFAIRHYSSASS